MYMFYVAIIFIAILLDYAAGMILLGICPALESPTMLHNTTTFSWGASIFFYVLAHILFLPTYIAADLIHLCQWVSNRKDRGE